MNNLHDILNSSEHVASVGKKPHKNRLLHSLLLAIGSVSLLAASLMNVNESKAETKDSPSIVQNTSVDHAKLNPFLTPKKDFVKELEKLKKTEPQQNSSTVVANVSEDEQNIINSRVSIEKLGLTMSDNRDSIVEKALDNNENFMAFAVRLEDIKTTVYYDPGGANIGAGFCITKQLELHPRAEVIKMLEDAKIDHETAVALTNPKMTDLKNPKRKLAKGLSISPESALILTKSLQKSYEATLIAAFDTAGATVNPKKGLNQGSELFKKLSANERASYTWLNYNADISRFKRLNKAIYTSHDDNATPRQKAAAKALIMNNLAPMYRDNGTLVKNTRAEAYLTSGMYDEMALSYALRNPNEIEARQGDVASLGKYLKNQTKKMAQGTSIAIKSLAEKGIATKDSIKKKILKEDQPQTIAKTLKK